MKRASRRYAALIEFKGEIRLVTNIRAWDLAHANELIEKRRELYFRANQVPIFQQKTWRLLGVFYGTPRYATE